jgi:hypothetical protein
MVFFMLHAMRFDVGGLNQLFWYVREKLAVGAASKA